MSSVLSYEHVAKTVKPRDTPNKRTKNGGKFSRDDIDWDLAESFYVQGEIIIEKTRHGDLERKKPSLKDVAMRFGCPVSTLHYQSKKRKWQEKRETWERMAAKEVSEAVAKARALSFAEGAAILDAWLLKFEQAVKEDKVRFDSISDFNTALRLKAFIEAQGSNAADTNSEVTLADLQRKHKEQRARGEQTSRAMTGVLEPEGDLGPLH